MSKDIIQEFTSKEYEHGWESNLETDSAPKGLNEDIIRFISAKKNEPEWLLGTPDNNVRQCGRAPS